ncbi:MAG: phenylalanine--tRNA ligase subunit beta [Deltaproteobacteria bacterium]|jgi:phenylalanyl-tRNA synthetase beta chain|nr:phenylalanine--tRNA ligase subunit beta [Deltaproteobacteria bacterium]
MRVGLAWLGDFVGLGDLTPTEVADKLTMIGLEVEDLFDRLGHLSQVVAGRALSVKAHDRGLSLVTVGLGDQTVEVLCGAPNVREGGLYPLAPVGAQLPGGLVKAKTLAGLVSAGFLCSALELGLPGGGEILLELPASLQPGDPLKKLYPLADWIFDLSITPNRADALSARGVARDLAAALNRPLKEVRFDLRESGRSAVEQARVDIDCPERCWRYCARILNNVVIGPSPQWLVDRLAGAGLRSINNAVDVTNYVMLELGLPLHAFDLAQLAQSRIVVRLAGPGTEITTLDGQKRVLKAPENILICDGERPVALGGIMGCLNSEVESSTRDILLEGACFDPQAIRRSSRSLGLSTDASYRFERGQDPNLPPLAVDRAAALLAEISGAEVALGRLDAYPRERPPAQVFFSPRRCADLLGVDHAPTEVPRVLTAIGARLSPAPPDANGELFAVTLPTFRPDLSREVDLYEEVVRLLDFQSLPARLPKPPAISRPAPPQYRLRQKLREILSSLGLSESLTYSFINPAFDQRLGLADDHPWRRRLVRVLNPLSEEHGVLRPSLLPGLLGSLRLNQSHGRWAVALFEVGATFHSRGENAQPLERPSLGLLWAGTRGAGRWNDPEIPVDFWDLKGVFEELGERFGLDLVFEPLTTGSELDLPFYEPGQAAVVKVKGELWGHLGRLGQAAHKAWGLKAVGGPVLLGELDLSSWPVARSLTFQGWSSYPGVYRDLAIVVSEAVPARALVETIQADPSLPLSQVEVFDIYQGEKIPRGQKSLAFRLFFQSPERTLTDELVNGYFNSITTRLAERFSATLRA